uniref:Golgin-45 n=1 Tax=Stomoxys calcitrans TaxID=35570 RepID=A0A1I8PP71_STOCA
MEVALMDLEKCRTSGDGMEDLQEKVAEQTQSDNSKQNKEGTQIEETNEEATRKASISALDNKQKTRKSSSGSSSGKANHGGLPLPGLHTLYRRPECVTRSLKPVVPKGELVMMRPRMVDTTNAVPEHKKTKPPKFIPYEPYPGAVNPIVPKATSGSVTPNSVRSVKVNRNNLDIGVLVSQMSTIRSQEMQDTPTAKQLATSDPLEKPIVDCVEVEKLREELQKAKEERDYFQGQFKFQTQVNAELKNLLVASVGEDLLTRVNLLTEDKLQLARALLDTAKNLTTHTEQIEFLAGQCEVWRSKFLASSVMVEELARWKADLTQKNQMLNESTKRLLHSTHQIRQMQLDVLKNLKFLAKIRYLNLPATDVITLSAENLNILQQMVLHSGVGMPEGDLSISSATSSPLCDSEKYAVQALEFISQPLMATDEAIKALFGQAQRPYIAPTPEVGAENVDSNKLSTK